MKIKILTGIVISVIAITVIISTASKSQNITENDEKPFPDRVEKIASKQFIKQENYEVERNEWNHKPINPNISLEELAGHVNKEYEIREDILRYIEKEIPPDNEKAKKAAIAYAQINQFIYYKVTEKDAIKAANRSILALHCLGEALPDRQYIVVAKNIDKLMRNTPERDKHMWDIDEKFFGWKVMGFGDLSTKQLKEICENESY